MMMGVRCASIGVRCMVPAARSLRYPAGPFVESGRDLSRVFLRRSRSHSGIRSVRGRLGKGFSGSRVSKL